MTYKREYFKFITFYLFICTTYIFIIILYFTLHYQLIDNFGTDNTKTIQNKNKKRNIIHHII